MSKKLLPDDGTLWSIRAFDISGNYGQNLKLDASSNLVFSTNGATFSTLGSNIIQSTTTNGLNVQGTYYSNNVSALKIPADSSNNRPAGETGYIRYNTDTNIIEYWNNFTSSWIPISEPTPTITNISPSWIGEDQSNNFIVTGNYFNTSSTISFIGNVNSVEYPAATTNYVSTTQLTTINTLAMTDVSVNTAFFVKVVNTNTSFSYTTPTAILEYNTAPFWISPAANASVGTGIQDQVYSKISTPFTDLSANDTNNTPINFFNSSVGPLPAGVLMDASNGKLYGTMPSTTTTYGFSAYPQDASGVIGSLRAFSFVVASKFMSITYSGNFSTGTYITGGYTYRWVSWRPTSNTTSNTTYTNAVQVTYTSGITPFNQIEFLIIAGGGGGGAGWQGGGGGAGGLISSGGSIGGSGGGGSGVGPYVPTVANFNIVVGGGGAGGIYSTSGSNATPQNGGDSSLFGYTATGGGRGAGEQNLGTPSLSYSSTTGGSGGAGSHGGSTTGSAGTTNQGYAGGNGISSGSPAVYNGGGGGGAGAVGGNSTLSPDVAGSGGSGLANSITGVSTTYAGGGGGSSRAGAAGSGGMGGGGAGGANASGTSGTVGTGGGGGAASNSSSGGFAGQVGGTGGTGIVIIRYIIA